MSIDGSMRTWYHLLVMHGKLKRRCLRWTTMTNCTRRVYSLRYDIKRVYVVCSNSKLHIFNDFDDI